MCIDKILSLFMKQSAPAPTPEPEPLLEPSPEPLTLPHPEEAPDYSKTFENTDLNSALDEWETNYDVPDVYRNYWKTKIVIKLDADLPYPAAAYELDGARHLKIRPEWVNSGVIAHEQAHNSYALLSDDEKAEFSTTYAPLKTTNHAWCQ